MKKCKYVFIWLGVSLAVSALPGCHNSNSLARQGLKNLEQGKKITALKFFEEALDANKKNPLALYGKGKIMTESTLTMSLGQKLIESALPKLDSEYKTDAILSLGKSYAATNLYSRAIKVMENSLAEGTHDPEIYIDLSFYNLQILEKNQARNVLLKGLQANPKSVRLYITLSNLDLKYFHDNYSALQSLEKAWQIEKNNQDVVKSIAVLYYKTGDVVKTVEFLKILKDLQTDNADKLNTEKWILQAQSRQWQINP
jgi:lipopolysaccharide biosynthesis regulator YciM